MTENSISTRQRDGNNLGSMSVADFINIIQEKNRNYQ
jgi:threonyl-tRNA synthetase